MRARRCSTRGVPWVREVNIVRVEATASRVRGRAELALRGRVALPGRARVEVLHEPIGAALAPALRRRRLAASAGTC